MSYFEEGQNVGEISSVKSYYDFVVLMGSQVLAVMLSVVSLVLFIAGAYAFDVKVDVSSIRISPQDAKKGHMAKMGLLSGLYYEYQTYQEKGGLRMLGKFRPSLPSISTSDGYVCIDAISRTNAHDLLADLKALGMRRGETFGRMVGGCLSIDSIDNAARLHNLLSARPAIAMQNVGVTTTQGDQAISSDLARATLGINGSGIMVGTLSSSFDCLNGAAADVASGDLPPGIDILDDTVCPETDEGRALMQIITDIAPAASQAFHTAFTSQAGFAQGIIDLQNVGADVIIDDVIYFAEPMFQDGIIAQAADQVSAAGTAYFSSAGNAAQRSYEQPFRGSARFEPFFGGELHDFDPGVGIDTFQAITLPVGDTIFSFQWNDVYASAGPGGSSTDYDFWLCLSPQISAENCLGVFLNNIDGDPTEVFGVTVTGSAGIVYVALSRVPGSGGRLLKYVTFGPLGFSFNEYATQSSTLYGHANATGAEAVGAAYYQETPAFGTSPPLLEFFSSRGGTPIYFDTNGNPIGPLVRQKPEIVAPDGVNNTFFPQTAPAFPDPENDGFPNLFGTSAAAPHAAAAAALMLQCDSSLSPHEVYEILEHHAVDMLTPGFDFDSGYGLIDVLAAVEKSCGKSAVLRDLVAIMILRAKYGRSFVPGPATGMVYSDVQMDDFAAAWIERLNVELITEGCGDGKYCRKQVVTKEQLAKMLLRAKYGGAFEPGPASGLVFADVSEDDFAADWIEELAAEGITEGCDDQNFCPKEVVTLSGLVKLLEKTFP